MMHAYKLQFFILTAFSFHAIFPLQRIRHFQALTSRISFSPFQSIKPSITTHATPYACHELRWGLKSIVIHPKFDYDNHTQRQQELSLVRAQVQAAFFDCADNFDELFLLWKNMPAHMQRFLLVATNNAGETAFLRAVMKGNLEVAHFLLTRGADRDAVTHFGKNALYFAIKNKDESMKLLLAQK